MEGVGLAFFALIVVAVLAIALRRQRQRAASVDLEDKSWLRTTSKPDAETARTAPVRDFHVHGNEARVSFDVPLPEEEDPFLHDLLVDEAMELVREKRHTLPMSDVTEIVVFAGRGEEVREVGRTKLPSPGELPPPIDTEVFNLTHIARDPLTSQFEVDHGVHYETAVRVPTDELGPLRDELKVPAGLDRGLRARGVDPNAVSGPDFMLALLELFGYRVVALGEPGVYMASKGNVDTFIRTETYQGGQHPELDEAVVRKFLVEYGTSGAARGLLITDKYGPFMMYDIEDKDQRVRFVTRERAQAFIDSMALG